MRYLLLFLLCLYSVHAVSNPCGAYYSDGTTCINCTTGILLMNSTDITCSAYETDATTDQEYCYQDATTSLYFLYDGDKSTGSPYFSTAVYSDAVVLRNTLVDVCYDCQDYVSANCTTCYDNSTFLSSVELRTILLYSIGCSVCEDRNSMTLTYESRLQLYVRNCSYTGDYSTACSVTQYYDTHAESCLECSSKFPNCAACNSTDCIICNENFYYSTMLDYDGNAYKMCAFQMCQLNYGPDMQNKTTCLACTFSNCRSCIYQANGTQICQFCNKGYYRADDGTCTKQASSTIVTYYVQAAGFSSSVSSTTILASTGTFAKPFYFLQQALIQAERNTFQYKQVTTNIYLLLGTHYYFQCDSSYYDPSSYDSTATLKNYCAVLGQNISTYYFINDNNQVYIRALLCTDAATLGLSSYTGKCKSTSDSKPTIYINSPRFFFNITNYYYFENIIFSGANAFAYVKNNSDVSLEYFPVPYCNMSYTPMESDNIFYNGSSIPNKTNVSTKCNSSNTVAKGLQSCEGEPYFASYFNASTAINGSFGGGVYYEQRRKTLFNLYGFNDFSSQINTPPTLILDNCDFKHFMYGYESLINVETYSMYMNTAPSISYVTNSYVYYTSTGRDKGANIQITDSTFQFSRFCKGAIVYRKPPFIDDFQYIFNMTHQFSNVRTASYVDTQIIMVNSTFTQMNYGTNQTAFTKYGSNQAAPQLALYTGITDQEDLYVDAFMHKGIIINTDSFSGPIEIYDCQIINNTIFIPEILMVNSSVGQTYDLTYFENTVTNEYEMTSCNYDTSKNQYFLSNAFNDSDALDQLVLEMDRMSTFYISKNYGPVIFSGSNFSMNIGTFGGAIHISSPNFDWASNSYVIISNCSFTHNMAYFSGGAVYVRSTLRESSLQVQVCAGTHIMNSTFTNNMGLKKGNGGAVTLYCDYINRFGYSQADLVTSSGITRRTNATYYNYTEFTTQMTLAGYAYSGEKFKIYKETSSIQNSTFTSNYVGFKGSAVYLRYVSQIIVYNCTFTKNGPTYSTIESTISPYYQQFTNQSIQYYDEKGKCKSELEFLQKCNVANITIEWPQVQGALAVEFCGETMCMSSSVTQAMLINYTYFVQNDAGPYLSTAQKSDMANALYISGGFNNNVSNSLFVNQSGQNASNLYTSSSTLYNYMPPNYFNYSQAPQIRIQIEPDACSEALNFTTTFTNCTFYNNSNVQVLGTTGAGTYSGSLINYVSNVDDNALILPKFNFYSSSVTDNVFLGSSTSLFYVNNAQVMIEKNKFINNGYISTVTNTTYSTSLSNRISYYEFTSYSFPIIQQYGVFWLDIDYTFYYSFYHTVYLNTFKFIFADEGCAFKMDLLNQNFLMSRNTIQYNFAKTGGAHMSVFSSGGYNVLQLQNETLSYLYGGTYGAIYSDNLENTVDNQLVFYIKDSSFSNCNAQYGAAISAQQVSKVYSGNVLFNKLAQTNETYYVVSQFVKARRALSSFVSDAIISSYVTQVTNEGYVYLINTYNVHSIDFGGAFLQDSSYEYLYYNEFINCTFVSLVGTYGTTIYAESAKILVENDAASTTQGFQNTSGSIGTISVNLNSVFVARNVIIQNNKVVRDGAAIFSDASSISLYNCLIQNNSAIVTQGIIFVQGNSQMYIDTTSFLNNKAYEASCIYANMNKKYVMTITNSLFQNNTSTLTLMNLKETSLIISNSQFVDNIAQTVTHGITMSNSVVTMINSAITYTDPDFIYNNDFNVDVGFFNLIYMSTLNLTSGTNIQNCRGKTAATIYAASKSNVFIEKNVIIQNCKSSEGSNINIALANQVSINQSTFINNSLIDIYFERVNLSIANSKFYNGDNTFLYGYYSNVTMSSVEFENITNEQGYGGGLYCSCFFVQVANCSFTNLVALYGGAMYLDLDNPYSYSDIQNSLFLDNRAQYGGAIYIETVNILNLTANQFIGNQAVAVYNPLFSASADNQGIGGAIFYACTDAVGVTCSTTLVNQNQFIRNSATHQGGAIKYLQNDYAEAGTPTLFQSNYAVYGADVASYPKFINYTFVTNNDNVTDDYQRRVLSGVASSWDIVSGIGFDIQFQIYDQQNNPYKIENTSIAELVAVGSNATLTNNMATANQGHFSFTNLQVLATPGSNLSLALQITGLSNYGNVISFIVTPISIDFKVRACVLGESWTADSACVLCPVTTYLLVIPSMQVNCSDCSPHAMCYSGSNIAPRDGYWRSANTSENFIKCPNSDSCLAGNISNPIGVCAEGYEGILCGDCIPYYTKSAVFHCSKCGSQNNIFVQIAVELILIILFTLFLTNSILKDVQNVGPPIAIYFKIITSYLQLIGIITSINFGWPNSNQKFLTGLFAMVDFSSKILQFDCLMQYQNDGNPPSIKNFYFQLVILFFLPLILFVISILVWVSIALVKRTTTFVREKILCTFIILIFLNYPAVITIMFQGFSCETVDKDKRLMADIDILCFEGDHLTFFLLLVLPGLVLWAIGIPLVQFIFLFKNRATIKKFNDKMVKTRETYDKIINVKTRYGFLLQGLKLESYAWEIVIYARKGLVIAFAVSLQTRYAESQTIICIMVIVISLVLQIWRKPYSHLHLNRLETTSIIVCLITIYCGMFYATSDSLPEMDSTGVRGFFFVVILLANLAFICLALFYIRIEVLKYLIQVYPKQLLAFKILAFGLMTPDTFKKAYMSEVTSREWKYKIEDEDLDDEPLGDSDIKDKIKNADQDEVNDASEKKDKQSDMKDQNATKAQEFDDIISRLYKSNQAKVSQQASQQTSKLQSVLNPKDIILDLKNNKSSDSLSVYSEEEEERSLKAPLGSERRGKVVKQKEPKVHPIDKMSLDTQSASKKSNNVQNKLATEQDAAKVKVKGSDKKNFNSTGLHNLKGAMGKEQLIYKAEDKHDTEANLMRSERRNNENNNKSNKSMKDQDEEMKEFDHDSEMSERKQSSKKSGEKAKKVVDTNQSYITWKKNRRKDSKSNISRYM